MNSPSLALLRHTVKVYGRYAFEEQRKMFVRRLPVVGWLVS